MRSGISPARTAPPAAITTRRSAIISAATTTEPRRRASRLMQRPRCSRRRPLRIRPCCGSLRSLSAATHREQQQLERHAMLDARISQQKAAEQTRIADRQAMLQARAEQQKAAEQARAAQRQAMAQERIDRQHALQQQIVEQRNAAEQKRAEQRQAVLQQRIDREQAQQQQRIGREQARQTGVQRCRPSRRGSRRKLSLQRIRSQPRRSARPPRVMPGTIRCATSSIRRTSRTRCRAIARRSLCKTALRDAAIRAPARSRRAGAASGA